MRPANLVPAVHLFVCVNRRDEGAPLGPGCGDAGEAVYEVMKGEVARSSAYRAVWITRTHCLGQCPKSGCTVAIYPRQRILTEVEEKDAAKVFADALGEAPAMKKKEKVDPKSPFAKLAGVKEKLAKEEEARAGAKKTPGRPDAPRAASGPRGPSASEAEDDRLAFHRMMSGVTPLDSPKGRVAKKDAPASNAMAARATAEQARAAAAAEAEEVHARLRALVTGDRAFETHDDGRRVEGRRIDVPQPMLRRLRQGMFPIDARVDLHGLGATEARQAVEAFVREKRAAGEKCLLIVHGKGDHSPRGQGVLRHEMAGWLAEGPASEHVAAFATATRDDGGEGAVYVLLRR